MLRRSPACCAAWCVTGRQWRRRGSRRGASGVPAPLRQRQAGRRHHDAARGRGRIFYNDAMSGFNFLRNRLPLTAGCGAGAALRRACARRRPSPRRARSMSECRAGICRPRTPLHRSRRAGAAAASGSAMPSPPRRTSMSGTTSAAWSSGRRRFTLFPPEQVANLYIGPLDFAPTGAPMSLVPLHAPDFARFPRFRTALAAALSAELAAGRCPLHSAAVVASRRVAGAVQPAGELLVARRWHGSHRRPRGLRRPDPGDAEPARDARCHAQGLAALFEYYVFNSAGDPAGAYPRAAPRHARTALGGGASEAARAARAEDPGDPSDSCGATSSRPCGAAGMAARRCGPRPRRGAPRVDVIPEPAQVSRGAGTFTLGASTVGGGGHGRRGAPSGSTSPSCCTGAAAALGCEPAARARGRRRRVPPGSGVPAPRAESYEIEVDPRAIIVTAREPRGLFYGAVTLWQLCTPVRRERRDARGAAHPAMRRASAGAGSCSIRRVTSSRPHSSCATSTGWRCTSSTCSAGI